MPPLSWLLAVICIVCAVSAITLPHGQSAAANARQFPRGEYTERNIAQNMPGHSRNDGGDLSRVDGRAAALPGSTTNSSDSTAFDIDHPLGYEPVFNNLSAANNAEGFMGADVLDQNSTAACADRCNRRLYDQTGGLCQYFNIYTSIEDGTPHFKCSMYWSVTDGSTATNQGGGNVKIADSRGYSRVSAIEDGGFENSTTCDDGGSFCHKTETPTWKGDTSSGNLTHASIFHYISYAHSGNGVGVLGELNQGDNASGTLTPTKPLNTALGKNYTVAFFHWSNFNDPTTEEDAFVSLRWNSEEVWSIRQGSTPWTFYSQNVTAQGNDKLEFIGGKAPAWSFIDDVFVFLNP